MKLVPSAPRASPTRLHILLLPTANSPHLTLGAGAGSAVHLSIPAGWLLLRDVPTAAVMRSQKHRCLWELARQNLCANET